MDTPICDFVEEYIEKDKKRLHMPGHKGIGTLCEDHDITEIDGADSLYDASGIIKKSEENATALFNMPTFYSAEGSSLAIRAMLYIAMLWGKKNDKKPRILAFRNAHKVFLSAAALLDIDVRWVYGNKDESYLSCNVTAEDLDAMLSEDINCTAVYVTSPDYLGNMADIKAIASVCHRHGALLLVDNAHGAYLKFLRQSLHPIDLGADMCADSAHKTLPVLTGGAYLHISPSASSFFSTEAKGALALFGSTSPSYLILQSLDKANRYIAEGYRQRLDDFIIAIEKIKYELQHIGYTLCGDEPMKITIEAKPYGLYGEELAQALAEQNIILEFYDTDYAVMMPTPEIGESGIKAILESCKKIAKKPPLEENKPKSPKPRQVLSIREATMSESERLPIEDCCGKILARANVSCPPAVPIIVCGELIDKDVVEALRYYGKDSLEVLK